MSYAQSAAGKADLIITNANVYTVNAKQPTAGRSPSGARIVAVGLAANVKGWSGPRTKTIDAQGRLVLPVFMTAHSFHEGALSL